MRIAEKVFIITGGGDGIGRQLTLHLLDKGAQVAVVDINELGLKKTKEQAKAKSAFLSTHVLDITNREKVQALPKAVIEQHGSVDGLINNAGIIQPFVEVNDLGFDDIEHVMNVNFYGTLNMIKAFLPHLLERPEAHIANVSSMGAYVPVPGQTVYGASKAAVKLLTEGLYAELKETGVGMTVVLCGAVNTGIAEHSDVTVAGSEEQQQSFKMLEPAQAASQIIRAIEKNKYRVLVGQDARMMDLISRLSPKWAANMIYKQMKGLLG